ncbi:MAG: ECF transporter S component [Ardenticatenaceae bacterium]|nr:ECF transporter S component [Ardenticatenaceae bacterium]
MAAASADIKQNLWAFGTRQVVYAAIGAALYGVFSWATNFLALPAAGNISLRPAVAIPMFFGIAFGPVVGFFSGLVGNILGDFLSGWGFFWNWSLGNGIMGLIPGLMAAAVVSFRHQGTIIKAIVYVVVAVVAGMLFASLTSIPIDGIDMTTALVGYFWPAALSNIINGVILVPILMVAYDSVINRSGR